MAVWSVEAERLEDVAQLRALVARRELIGDMCREVSGARDTTDAIRICARYVLKIFPDAARSSVALVDADGVHSHVHGLAGEMNVLSVGTRLPLASTTIGRCIREHVQIVVHRADPEPTPEIAMLWKIGMNAIVVTPFVIEGRSLGSLNLSSPSADAFGTGDQGMLTQLAAIIAASLDRHRLIEALQLALQDSQRREQELAEARAEQAEVIRAQQVYLDESASPVIPISERIIVIPVVGALDEARARHFVDIAVRGGYTHQAETVIIDLTGVSKIDPAASHVLITVSSALRLLGASVVFTGIPPALAESLVHLGVDLSGLRSSGTLQTAIAGALGRSDTSRKR